MSETKQEVATVAEHQPAPLVKSDRRAGAIVPTTIEQSYRLAVAICRGGMAPKSYENNPERVMVAIMHGMEVGLTPMAAVQSIAVINGFPTIWGDGALGLVRASGLLDDIEERIDQEGDDLVAVCTVQRRGQKTPVTNRFTWSEAKRAGLSGKSGPWQQYPRRMMQMRARSWCLRDAFPDVLRGLHLAEEIVDMDDAPLPTARPTRKEVAAKASAKPAGNVDKAFGAAPGPDREPTEAERREADRLMRQANGEDLGEPEEDPAPATSLRPIAAPDNKNGRPDWGAYAELCINAITDIRRRDDLEAWYAANKPSIDKAPPSSCGDKIRAAFMAREEALAS